MANGGPRWAAMTAPKGAMIAPGNDDRHNLIDSNMGGSPRGGKGTKNIAPAQRGGFGHNGRDIVAQRASMGGGRSGSGNPASRGGFKGVARGGAFKPETRVSGHGGAPQTRSNIPAPRGGGFGMQGHGSQVQNKIAPGQVSQYPQANPQPTAGNTSGRSYKLIAGRFKRAAMGAKAGQGDAMGGKYGSPPVTANT